MLLITSQKVHYCYSFHECSLNSGEHEFNKYSRLPRIVRGIDGVIILILAVVNNRFYWKENKNRIPLRKQKSLPQSPDATITIRKGMKLFKFVVERTTTDQHVNRTIFHPFQKFRYQIRYILG